MSKMRVAFFSSPTGGLAHYIAHLYPHLRTAIEPYYVTYPYEDEHDNGLVHDVIGEPHYLIHNNSSESILETIHFLEEQKIDVVNFHIGTTARKMWLHYVALMSQLRLRGIPIVITIHDVLPFESIYIDISAVELLYSLGDADLVGNAEELNKLQTYFPRENRLARVVAHGPYTLFDRKTWTREEARRSLNIPDSVTDVILFFGFLRPHKGLEFLVRALPRILKKHPNSLLLIASDLHHNPTFRKDLEQVKASIANDKIIINTSYIGDYDIERYFRAASLVALPYTRVSQSGVLNLAYAFETPVVLTDIFPEASKVNGVYGKVVHKGRVARLADGICEALQPEQLSKYRENLRQRLLADHTWAQTAASMLEVFQQVMRS